MVFSCTRLRQKRPNFIEKFSQAVSTAKVERYLVTTTGYSVQLIKGTLSRRFCCILVKTAEIFDKEPGL